MRPLAILLFTVGLGVGLADGAAAQIAPPRHDLAEIQASGRLRHLGLTYANFVTGAGGGLDAELVKLFCREIGVEYVYVETTWERTLSDVTGLAFTRAGDEVVVTGPAEVRGDLIAHGLTVVPWREKLVDFAAPTFPAQVWLVAPASVRIAPIVPTGSVHGDIARTYGLVGGFSVLVKPDSFLDPTLFDLAGHGAQVVRYEGSLNHMAPNLLGGMADLTVLDVPDALVALHRWQGKLKVLGPLSEPRHAAVAFPKDSPQLKVAFDAFLERCRTDGTCDALVRRYYPGLRTYFPDFLAAACSVQ